MFTSGAGRARVENLGDGLMQAVYSGAIGVAAFANLRGDVIHATEGARVILIDMTAVLATSVLVPPIPTSVYRANHAPGVVICRKDQLAVWRKYAQEGAQIGVTRLVFSDALRPLALAAAQALLGQ